MDEKQIRVKILEMGVSFKDFVIFMGRRPQRAERDTYNYTLYGGFGQPVYHGITNNPQRRIRQHEQDGKFFTDYQVSPARSRSRADRDETNAIHHHQDVNLGMAPSYNIAKVKPSSWRLW
jgi:predicted GIY-YIG superfamily endonuclease